MTSAPLSYRRAAGKHPLPSAWPVALAGLLAASVVGIALARDVSVGIALLVGLVYIPIVLLNLPLGIALWIPLAFLDRVAATSFGPTLVAILILIAWVGVLTARSAYVARVLRAHASLYASVALLVVWGTLSLAWATDVGATLDEFWQWYVVATVMLVVSTSLVSRRHLVGACTGYVIGAVLSMIASLLIGQAGADALSTQEAGRLGAGLVDPNYLAAGLVPAMAIAAGLAAEARSLVVRGSFIAAIFMLAVGLTASGSRGGLIAAAVAIAAALVFVQRRRMRLGALVAIALTVIGLGTATTSSATWERVREFDTSGTGRVDLWKVAIEMGTDHPLVGVGINNFRPRSAEYVRQPTDLKSPDLITGTPHVVHNIYLQQFAETGLIGLALTLVVLFLALRATWLAGARLEAVGDHRLGGLARAVLIAQIGSLTTSVFLSNALDQRIWILLGLGPALLMVARRAEADPESVGV